MTGKEIKSLLGKTDQEILGEIGMANLPLIVHVLHRKYGGKVQLIDIGGDCMIRYGETNAANMSYLPAILHFLTVEGGKTGAGEEQTAESRQVVWKDPKQGGQSEKGEILTLEGNVSIPYAYRERCVFHILANGEEVPCEMFDAGMDQSVDDEPYELRTAFKVRISLPEDGEELRVTFAIDTDGIRSICGKINSMRFMPVADVLPRQYAYISGCLFRIEGNALTARRAGEEEAKEAEAKFREACGTGTPAGETAREDPEEICRVLSIRERFFEERDRKARPLFLVMDRPDRADDNGEVFFRYLRREHPEVDARFVLTKESLDYARIQEIGTVLPFGSEEHLLSHLLADAVISSQCNGPVENPFWGDAELFRDLYHRPKIIFLQHGTIKDDMSLTLNRFNTNFTGFVTSTKDEYQSILDYPYHYTEKEVWLTGQPRYDELYDAREKIILFMPSWRKSLMEQVWNEEKQNMEWRMKTDFSESEFNKKYRAVFLDKELIEICKAHGYRMVVCLHPLMREYAEQLVSGTICETAGKGQAYKDLFAKAALMVTDYSSVAFDFAYLKKPVIYYQFDKKDFFKEHTYKQGYFDYKKDGFGPVCENKKEMVNRLIRYIKNSCEPDINDRAKIERIGFLRNHFCERVFEKIMHPEVG